MQLLSEEKNLKSDETPFWDGSYLLDGAIDQNGYSKDTVTINARLRPPHGGTPLLFEVSGSRTNLSEVVNALALKIAGLLKVNATVKQWDAASEASQYFDEASWALKWGVLSEAQAAADSAWALGKKDLPCAVVRVKAYILDVSTHLQIYQTLDSGLAPTYSNGKPVTTPPSEAEVRQDITENSAQHRRTLYEIYESADGATDIKYVFADTAPDPKNIDRAVHALELYYEFSRSSPDGQPKILTSGPHWNDWHNTEWYQLGIADLEAASQVLRDFNFDPASQPPVDDKLSDLRALVRSVATLISQSPSIHDGYYVGGRLAPRDDLYHTMQESPNIFRCEVNWGCFWQERPEDSISLYRELMSSPFFSYIHNDFWNRTLLQPRLIAWNDEDARQIPVVWSNFMQELHDSTNVFLNMEAWAIKAADATNDLEMAAAITNLLNGILQNRGAFVTNNVEVMYLDWGVGDLVYDMPARGTPTDAKESFVQLYNTNYYRQFEAMDNEYTEKTILALKTAEAFEKQKEYLAGFTPYDFSTFVEVFSERNYTPSQAAELLPLVVAYESNLVANASGQQKFFAKANAQFISGLLERPINQILHPPAPRPSQPGNPVLPATIARINSTSAVVPSTASAVTNAPEIITNVLVINRSFTIPIERLVTLQNSEAIDPMSQVTITAHHWFGGKLLLDLDYDLIINLLQNGQIWNIRKQSGPAIAILDPSTGDWNIIACPELDFTSQNNLYNRSVLTGDHLLNSDGGQIRKYDFAARQWQPLKISDGNNYELFVINGQIYAANQNTIFEIIDDGNATRILASTRRQPPVSILDSQNLGTPVLFYNADNALGANINTNIFKFDGGDWKQDFAAPPSSFPPENLGDGLLFRHTADGIDQPMSISFLSYRTNRPELFLRQDVPHPKTVIWNQSPKPLPTEYPLWQMPTNLFLAKLPAAVRDHDLYLLVDHSKAQNIFSKQEGVITGQKILPQNGYHAELLCFSHDLPQPQKLFLRFEDADTSPPLVADDPRPTPFPLLPATWMSFSDHGLFLGLERPRNQIPFDQIPRTGIGWKCSVWFISSAEIEAACAPQKQIQQTQIDRARAAREKELSDLIAKYDRNHNGVIDPEEREDTLDDPAFIESELDKIDVNHDGWLEANELAYFDANQNKILDPKEEAGIGIAQHLLAVRLLKKFDADGKGYLTPSEFDALRQSFLPANQMPLYQSFPGQNFGPTTDLQGVQDFLKQLTVKSLRLPGSSIAIAQEARTSSGAVDKTQFFKLEVEYYWAHGEAQTN